MKKPPSPHYRHRFPAELISHAVWLYHVFSLSLRDVELILAERGVVGLASEKWRAVLNQAACLS
jgi:putative transposase